MNSEFSVAEGSPREREATVEQIEAFIREQNKSVVTFTGYSGAEYENRREMLDQAARMLDKHDPAKTIINIGATEMGIGAVYELAKRKGFSTIGIVSTLARDERVPLSKSVDDVFYVKDTSWGGTIPGTDRLSPTSSAIVQCSSSMIGIGGNDVARDEMLAARKAGKSVSFIPADRNHKIARDKARQRNQPEPTDFRGSAHSALAK